ncbi:hypothetical protein [Helicobacter bilis]|uniref:hypothetical protein n=1 Tax=Helicobacter bilis TaxID=37372 RepID=UPI0025AA273F|nr:hypothetical protein [Helicobacter bilis]
MRKILKTFKILSFIIIPPLIVFIYFFGWGWLVPYELQPSYWQFRNICKINELPNNEYKYNKILSYFDTDLESLDWEELNGKADTMSEQQYFYSPNEIEYELFIGEIKNSRYSMTASFYSNEKILRKDNITLAIILGKWHTNRYFLERKYMTDLPHQAEWIERNFRCEEISRSLKQRINNKWSK